MSPVALFSGTPRLSPAVVTANPSSVEPENDRSVADPVRPAFPYSTTSTMSGARFIVAETIVDSWRPRLPTVSASSETSPLTIEFSR